jgi:hypothetical protein
MFSLCTWFFRCIVSRAAIVLAALAWPVVLLAQAPAMDAAQAQAVLDGAGAKRAEIAQTEQAQRKACYEKFAASSCLKDAARAAQQQRADLRQQENAAKRVLREDRLKQQQQRLQERAAQPAPQTKELPEKRGPLTKPSAPSVKAIEKRPPLQGQMSSAQMAANEAEHAKRLQEAKAKQAEIEKRVAERAAKKAQQQAKQQQTPAQPAKP